MDLLLTPTIASASRVGSHSLRGPFSDARGAKEGLRCYNGQPSKRTRPAAVFVSSSGSQEVDGSGCSRDK